MGEGAPHPHRLGHQPRQLRVPVGERQIQQIPPVDRQRVEEDGETGTLCAAVATSTREPTRPAVSWKERGRPSSSSAITSPSRMNRVPFNSIAAEVSSGSRSVMSSRVRV